MPPFVNERFHLSKLSKIKLYSLSPKFGSVFGEAVYYRTYSRIKEGGGQEKWADTVIRVIEGVMSIHKDYYIKHFLEWNDNSWQLFASEMAEYMFHMRFLPAGRGLWAMGTDQAYTRGAAALYNCSASRTFNLCEDAAWVMDMLMNGCGTGIKVDDWDGKAFPPDKEQGYKYVIPDSREGWVSSLYKLINAYVPSKNGDTASYPYFDFSKIRPAGQQLKTFGGISSGPDPLINLLTNIENVLDRHVSGNISALRTCADIMNFIGCCVVAGNVRRSSEVLLCGAESPEYDTFVNLKNYEMNPERCNFGYMSNNSIILSESDHFNEKLPDIAKRILDNGEPGFLNLINLQKFGRYGELMHDDATLVNPCVAGDTLILTKDGLQRVDSLLGKQFTVIVDGNEYPSTKQGFWCNGDRMTYQLKTMSRKKIRATVHHKFLKEVNDPAFDDETYVWTELCDFNSGDIIKMDGVCEDIHWVEQCGIEKVYDCSIPGPNCYIANGFYSHNCGEIALEHRETCNLSETFPTRCYVDDIFSQDMLMRAIQFATFYCKTVSLLPTHHRTTNSVIAKNRRIGVSISGITEFITLEGMTRVVRALRNGYKTIITEDIKFSKDAGIPTSIRHSTIKPSGSISQLVGVPSGMHFPTFKYAIRRMRVSTNSKFCEILKISNVPNELEYHSVTLAQGQIILSSKEMKMYGIQNEDNLIYENNNSVNRVKVKILHPDTTVFEFPVDLGIAREAGQVSAWEQFSLLAMLQREWSDNLISCTVMYNKETEGNQIEHMLAQFAPVIKSVSMLPHSDTGSYDQMPYEGITREEYLKKSQDIGQVDWSNFLEEGVEPVFCTGDKCSLGY